MCGREQVTLTATKTDQPAHVVALQHCDGYGGIAASIYVEMLSTSPHHMHTFAQCIRLASTATDHRRRPTPSRRRSGSSAFQQRHSIANLVPSLSSTCVWVSLPNVWHRSICGDCVHRIRCGRRSGRRKADRLTLPCIIMSIRRYRYRYRVRVDSVTCSRLLRATVRCSALACSMCRIQSSRCVFARRNVDVVVVRSFVHSIDVVSGACDA
jgi:hypothetical protein